MDYERSISKKKTEKMNKKKVKTKSKVSKWKVIPMCFQKSNKITPKRVPKRSTKDLKKNNKSLALALQEAKEDITHQQNLLQEYAIENSNITLAKRKLQDMAALLQSLTSGLQEVVGYLSGTCNSSANLCVPNEEIRMIMKYPDVSVIDESAGQSQCDTPIEDSSITKVNEKSSSHKQQDMNQKHSQSIRESTSIEEVSVECVYSNSSSDANANSSRVLLGSNSRKKVGSKKSSTSENLSTATSSNTINLDEIISQSPHSSPIESLEGTSSPRTPQLELYSSKSPQKSKNAEIGITKTSDPQTKAKNTSSKTLNLKNSKIPVKKPLSPIVPVLTSTTTTIRRETFAVRNANSNLPVIDSNKNDTFVVSSSANPTDVPATVKDPITVSGSNPSDLCIPNKTIFLFEDMELTEIIPTRGIIPLGSESDATVHLNTINTLPSVGANKKLKSKNVPIDDIFKNDSPKQTKNMKTVSFKKATKEAPISKCVQDTSCIEKDAILAADTPSPKIISKRKESSQNVINAPSPKKSLTVCHINEISSTEPLCLQQEASMLLTNSAPIVKPAPDQILTESDNRINNKMNLQIKLQRVEEWIKDGIEFQATPLSANKELGKLNSQEIVPNLNIQSELDAGSSSTDFISKEVQLKRKTFVKLYKDGKKSINAKKAARASISKRKSVLPKKDVLLTKEMLIETLGQQHGLNSDVRVNVSPLQDKSHRKKESIVYTKFFETDENSTDLDILADNESFVPKRFPGRKSLHPLRKRQFFFKNTHDNRLDNSNSERKIPETSEPMERLKDAYEIPSSLESNSISPYTKRSSRNTTCSKLSLEQKRKRTSKFNIAGEMSMKSALYQNQKDTEHVSDDKIQISSENKVLQNHEVDSMSIDTIVNVKINEDLSRKSQLKRISVHKPYPGKNRHSDVRKSVKDVKKKKKIIADNVDIICSLNNSSRHSIVEIESCSSLKNLTDNLIVKESTDVEKDDIENNLVNELDNISQTKVNNKDNSSITKVTKISNSKDPTKKEKKKRPFDDSSHGHRKAKNQKKLTYDHEDGIITSPSRSKELQSVMDENTFCRNKESDENNLLSVDSHSEKKALKVTKAASKAAKVKNFKPAVKSLKKDKPDKNLIRKLSPIMSVETPLEDKEEIFSFQKTDEKLKLNVSVDLVPLPETILKCYSTELISSNVENKFHEEASNVEKIPNEGRSRRNRPKMNFKEPSLNMKMRR